MDFGGYFAAGKGGDREFKEGEGEGREGKEG